MELFLLDGQLRLFQGEKYSAVKELLNSDQLFVLTECTLCTCEYIKTAFQ
jgi:hypothetical protein